MAGARRTHGQRSARVGGLAHALISILISVLATTSQAADRLTSGQLEQIRQLGAATLAKDRLPGLSIAIATDGQVQSFGFGHADLEHDVPVTAHSLFRTASISKWLTAAAALRLAEDGKLDLDAPVQKYCPQFPQQSATITARHLLSHLGGIRHYHGQNGESPESDAERQALAARISKEQSGQFTRYTDVIAPLDGFKDDPLLFQPGSRQRYTSPGYMVLACALEGASQTPYRVLMRESVFVPAGMTSTRDDDALAIIAHRAQGYARGPDGELVKARYRDISSNVAGGGHLATTEDLVRFASAFDSGKLVQLATRDRMMMRPKLSDGSDVPFLPPTFGMGSSAYYGMGVMISAVENEPVVLHSGSQAGTSTELLLAPESGVAIAVMANMSGWSGAHPLAAAILKVAGSR